MKGQGMDFWGLSTGITTIGWSASGRSMMCDMTPEEQHCGQRQKHAQHKGRPCSGGAKGIKCMDTCFKWPPEHYGPRTLHTENTMPLEQYAPEHNTMVMLCMHCACKRRSTGMYPNPPLVQATPMSKQH